MTNKSYTKEDDITTKTSLLPLLLRHCWFGDRKGIHPAKSLQQQSPEVLWDNFGQPGLTRSDLWKNRQITQKPDGSLSIS